MKIIVGAIICIVSLSGCTELARGVVAMNNQYQYNQMMQRSYAPIQHAPIYNPTTVRCMNLGGVMQCRQY